MATKKKIKPITIGEIKFPRNIPNLNQSLFNGVRILEFIRPSTRNIIEIVNDQILKSFPLRSGNKEIIKKTQPDVVVFDEILKPSQNYSLASELKINLKSRPEQLNNEIFYNIAIKYEKLFG